MKKIIVDYNKITKEILDLLVTTYPNGYYTTDIVSFRDKKMNLIDAVQVQNDDTIYLVKVSNKLTNTMEDYDTKDDTYEDFEEQDLLFETEFPEENVELDI